MSVCLAVLSCKQTGSSTLLYRAIVRSEFQKNRWIKKYPGLNISLNTNTIHLDASADWRPELLDRNKELMQLDGLA